MQGAGQCAQAVLGACDAEDDDEGADAGSR